MHGTVRRERIDFPEGAIELAVEAALEELVGDGEFAVLLVADDEGRARVTLNHLIRVAIEGAVVYGRLREVSR